ncbi:hypothetical protein D9M69_661390 [compost metagenome]
MYVGDVKSYVGLGLVFEPDECLPDRLIFQESKFIFPDDFSSVNACMFIQIVIIAQAILL